MELGISVRLAITLQILFKNKVMTFRLFNLFDKVSRKMDDGDIIFTFIDGSETRAKRICK